MSRPQKHTVDYFAHDADASQGKTLSILFNHFGHEGISAWWQLLEQISKTENHIIGIGNHEELEYLAATMRFQPARLTEILSKMADLQAIDKEMLDAGFIWSQNFVDRLESVYRVRKQALPVRPGLSGVKTALSIPKTELSIPETAQSKVKETKVNKTKEKKEATTEADFLEFVEETKSQYPDLDCEVEYRKFQLYWSESGRKLKMPKTAWNNWLLKARQISAESDALAQTRRASARGNERLKVPRQPVPDDEDLDRMEREKGVMR